MADRPFATERAGSSDPDEVSAYYREVIEQALRVVGNNQRKRVPHLHRERVPWCFRCDLREDEES